MKLTPQEVTKAIADYEPMIKGFAKSRAKQFFIHGYEPEDLEQLIREELWTGLGEYDPDRGASLSSYVRRLAQRAMWRITAANMSHSKVEKGLPPKRIPADKLMFVDDIYVDDDDSGSEQSFEYFQDPRQAVMDVIIWEESLARELSRITDERELILLAFYLQKGAVLGAEKVTGWAYPTCQYKLAQILKRLRNALDDKMEVTKALRIYSNIGNKK